jgi:hypothetical protein
MERQNNAKENSEKFIWVFRLNKEKNLSNLLIGSIFYH